MKFSTKFFWSKSVGVYKLIVDTTIADATLKYLNDKGCLFDTTDEHDGITEFSITFMPRKMLISNLERFDAWSSCPHNFEVDDFTWDATHGNGWAEYFRACEQAMSDDEFLGLFSTPSNQVEVTPFSGLSDAKSIKSKYRELSKVYHPDCGGNAADFNTLNEQFKCAMRAVA